MALRRHHVTALCLAAALFTLWALTRRPVTLGWASGTAFLVLVPALVVLALIARRRPPHVGREYAAAALLFVAGTVLTLAVWFRVWREDVWDLPGVTGSILDVIGIWPAVLVAAGMWSVEEVLAPPGGWPRLRARVAVGFVAGATGVVLYHVINPLGPEPTPLAVAMRMVVHDLGSLGPPGGLTYQVDAGHLAMEGDAGPGASGTTPYIALMELESGLARARALVGRADIKSVSLLLRSGGRELAHLKAGEADGGQPLWRLTRLDRSRLKNHGRLDAASLRAMLRDVTSEEDSQFLRWFAFWHTTDEVGITFKPQSAAEHETIVLQGAAWASANNIVREVRRYFPEINRFAVTLPRLTMRVQRADVGIDFRLQHRLFPPDRVLGLTLHEPAAGQATLEPARFRPQAPMAGFQVGLARFAGSAEDYTPGMIFERVGQLGFVVEAADDGTATIALDDGALRAGTVRLRAGETVTVGSRRLQNLGWLPRTAFARAGG